MFVIDTTLICTDNFYCWYHDIDGGDLGSVLASDEAGGGLRLTEIWLTVTTGQGQPGGGSAQLAAVLHPSSQGLGDSTRQDLMVSDHLLDCLTGLSTQILWSLSSSRVDWS